MNFLGYRVFFGVYKSWLYTQEEEEEEQQQQQQQLWGPWPDTKQAFLGFSLLLRQKACRPKKSTTSRGVHCIAIAPSAMARKESATSG